ncbi:MAG: Glycosyl transferase group 1 [Microgenomates group bacterium Gr01-1014_5]|nr:MAG: Glycosyl transferase group 1 [Microgenomates group bacterium Gr01-1014_5]
MKIALVHDYFSEFGGAERVLRVLSDMFPDAPIYIAFKVKGSLMDKSFADREIRESFLAPILRVGKLYSPLRFLAPFVWSSFDFSEYDLVIASSSWFITKGFNITRGFKVGKYTKVICYCHTPPRYLYGYETSINVMKYWPVKVYAAIVNHFLRMYDFWSAQKVDQFIANSEEVRARIQKFYRKEAIVIYPPVEVKKIIETTRRTKKDDFFLLVSRLVGGKGIEEAAEAANKIGFKLRVVGEAAGFSKVRDRVRGGNNLELLGRVNDEELYQLYARAKGFLAFARNEDFGMTVVEAQAAGTPVIAYNGGGFRETVVDGSTGLLIDDTSLEGLKRAFGKFERIKWQKEEIQENAKRFSRENFEKKITKLISDVI